jgi:hypothetical protein
VNGLRERVQCWLHVSALLLCSLLVWVSLVGDTGAPQLESAVLHRLPLVIFSPPAESTCIVSQP